MPHLVARPARRARLEEVVDHLDRPVEAEQAPGLVAEVLRHDRDGVGARQGVADGRAVAGVAAEQGGVGAVQRGDDPRPQLRRQHRPREDGGRGVRHGVVDVQHVEPVLAAHLGHLHRERQGVVGVLEQAVGVDAHRVEVDAGRVRRQPERALVADEMHVVPAAGELVAQRRREDAAAADRGIAGDADPERAVAAHVRIGSRCGPAAPANRRRAGRWDRGRWRGRRRPAGR